MCAVFFGIIDVHNAMSPLCFSGICGNTDSKITSVDASEERIGPAGAKLIGEALRSSVNASITQALPI